MGNSAVPLCVVRRDVLTFFFIYFWNGWKCLNVYSVSSLFVTFSGITLYGMGCYKLKTHAYNGQYFAYMVFGIPLHIVRVAIESFYPHKQLWYCYAH